MSTAGQCRSRGVVRAALAWLLVMMAGLACDQGSGPGGAGPVDGCEHVDYATGVQLVTRGVQVYRQLSTTSEGAIQVTAGSSVPDIEATFLRSSGELIVIPNDCTINEMRVEVTDGTVAEITRDPARRWFFDVVGRREGATTIRVLLWHANHAHFRSELIPVNVIAP